MVDVAAGIEGNDPRLLRQDLFHGVLQEGIVVIPAAELAELHNGRLVTVPLQNGCQQHQSDRDGSEVRSEVRRNKQDLTHLITLSQIIVQGYVLRSREMQG